MDDLLYSAVCGVLKSPAKSTDRQSVTFVNKLAVPATQECGAITVPIGLRAIASDGRLDDHADGVTNNATLQMYASQYCLVINSLSGALICVKKIAGTANESVEISALDLTPANYIGPFPTATDAKTIPLDSLRVLVGIGSCAGRLLTREQFWKRTSESMALAGNETRTVGFSKTSGIEETSSTHETFSNALNLQVSGGWGPVSASLSASLNIGSTTSQQITTFERTTQYETMQYTNAAEAPMVLHFWRLTDVITAYTISAALAVVAFAPAATLLIAQSPTLIGTAK